MATLMMDQLSKFSIREIRFIRNLSIVLSTRQSVTTSNIPLVHSTDPLTGSKDLCTTSSTQQPTHMTDNTSVPKDIQQ